MSALSVLLCHALQGRWNHIQVAMKEYIALRSTDINKGSNGNGGSGDPATDGTTVGTV